KRQLKRPDTLGLNLLDEQLILAARHVQCESAARDDTHAVAQVEPHAQSDGSIKDRLQRRLIVLESEVLMSVGAWPRQVRHLALDPDVGVRFLKHALDGAR